MINLAKSFLKSIFICLFITHILTIAYLAYQHDWSKEAFCKVLFHVALILAVIGCLMISGNDQGNRNSHVILSRIGHKSFIEGRRQDEEDFGKITFLFLGLFVSAILAYFETVVIQKFF